MSLYNICKIAQHGSCPASPSLLLFRSSPSQTRRPRAEAGSCGDGRAGGCNACDPPARRRSAETTGDVALGFGVLGVVEHRGSVREVLQVAGLADGLQVEEGGVIGDTGGLLPIALSKMLTYKFEIVQLA